MAVVEMSKMRLIGLYSEKDRLMNAMHKTGAVEIKETGQIENTFEGKENNNVEDLTKEADNVRRNLEYLVSGIDSYIRKNKDEKTDHAVNDGFLVKYGEFMSAEEKRNEIKELCGKISALNSEILENKTKSAKLDIKYGQYRPYRNLSEKFSVFSDTKKTCCLLGIISREKSESLSAFLKGIEDVLFESLGETENGVIISVIGIITEKEKIIGKLNEAGFVRCVFTDNRNAAEVLGDIRKEKREIAKSEADIEKELYSLKDKVRDIKIYLDYISFLIEKGKDEAEFRKTEKTFVLEAFVPKSAQDEVSGAVKNISEATFIEYSPIEKGEFAPTLLKNNKVAKNFEFVTNLYSPPAYGSLDPNAVMGIFFALFMGFIMADAVYGIIMIIGGLLLSAKLREGSGMKQLAAIIVYGGIFTLFFGVIFDSFLGFDVLRSTLGAKYNNFYNDHLDSVNASVSVAGIDLPALLLWSLGLGIIQISVSLILKAVQCFEKKQIKEGIFGGLCWAMFLLSVIVSAVGNVMHNSSIQSAGIYCVLFFLTVGILTAGISSKGFGKVGKSFGAIYGLINYASDILSYARLYGLMLSGAQLASIFSKTLAVDMLFPLGVGGIIFGVIIIIIGNAFNLAMGLLGAYIHDSRLQYIEFFGRFYEGEGELFRPLGSKFEHIVLAK